MKAAYKSNREKGIKIADVPVPKISEQGALGRHIYDNPTFGITAREHFLYCVDDILAKRESFYTGINNLPNAPSISVL